MTDVPLLFDPKTPDDVVDRSLDFKNILARGETINEADVFGTPDDLMFSAPTIDHTGRVVTTWVSGGTSNTSYYISYHIVTSGGKDETRSAIMNVKDIVP